MGTGVEAWKETPLSLLKCLDMKPHIEPLFYFNHAKKFVCLANLLRYFYQNWSIFTSRHFDEQLEHETNSRS